MTVEGKTPRKRAAAKAVPPATFSAPAVPEAKTPTRRLKAVQTKADVASVTELPVQMPPGFTNGQRVYETVPEPATPHCVERGGCKEPATQQVASRPHIRYCPRHGAEFEVRQQYVIDPWELEPIR